MIRLVDEIFTLLSIGNSEASRSDWARKLCAPKFAIVRKGGAPSIRLLRADKRERGRLQNEGKRRARSKRGIECGEASRGHLEAWFVANQPVATLVEQPGIVSNL